MDVKLNQELIKSINIDVHATDDMYYWEVLSYEGKKIAYGYATSQQTAWDDIWTMFGP